jgi:hypothetical protein
VSGNILIDESDPTVFATAPVNSIGEIDRPTAGGVIYPIGQGEAVVISGVPALQQGSHTFVCETLADQTSLLKVLNSNHKLLWRRPLRDGESPGDIRVRVVPGSVKVSPAYSAVNAASTLVTFSWVEQS